jgi:hypothetical protein
MFLDGPLAPVPTKSSVLFTASVQPISTAPRPSGSMTFYDNGIKIATRPLTPTSSGGAMAQLTHRRAPGSTPDRGRLLRRRHLPVNDIQHHPAHRRLSPAS